jgi:NADH:ubiquinone oxidoreductase subunit 2 (subunit N)
MKKIAFTGLALALPLISFAQPSVNSVQDAGRFFIDLINNVAVPLIFALAFIVFIYGVFKYFIAAGDGSKAKEGKNLMLYGLLGFFIMVSVWGLVNILVGSVDLENERPSELPQAVQPR